VGSEDLGAGFLVICSSTRCESGSQRKELVTAVMVRNTNPAMKNQIPA
jgi:hypothetical protein